MRRNVQASTITQFVQRELRPRAARHGWDGFSFWIGRVWRNLLDRPLRAMTVALAVAIGVAIAIAIIAASNGIERQINDLLNTHDPVRAASLRKAGVNLDNIESVLRDTRDLLTKLAIGFTAALVGLVTWINVSQRRRDIGLNVQYGYYRRQIISELIGESFLLCVVGGIAGVVLGNLLCRAISDKLPLLPVRPEPGDVLSIFPATTLLTFALTALIAAFFATFATVDTSL